MAGSAPRRLIVEADGGSRGNPGPAGYGALVREGATGEVIAEAKESIGVASNNVAEYSGLIAGLTEAARIDPDALVEVRMDSKLVIEQMSGRWQIKHEDMRRLAREARAAFTPRQITYTWIPRAQNGAADALANQAMDAAAGVERAPRLPRNGPSAASQVADRPAAFPEVPDPRPTSLQLAGTGGVATTVVLVRHGRTALTGERRFSGSGGSDPDLSPDGHADAARAAQVIARFGDGADWSRLRPVEAIYSSPLQRARTTAEIVAGGLPAPLPVTRIDDLTEVSYGQWDGLTLPEVARRWPTELTAWQDDEAAAPPGGESLAAAARRIGAVLDRIIAQHAGGTVALVCHKTPVTLIAAAALDASPLAALRVQADPGSVTVTRWWTPEDGSSRVGELLAQNLTR